MNGVRLIFQSKKWMVSSRFLVGMANDTTLKKFKTEANTTVKAFQLGHFGTLGEK